MWKRRAALLALFVLAAGCSADGEAALTTSEETSVITTTIPVTTTTAVSEPEPTTTTEPSVTTTTKVLLPGPAPKITFLFDQATVPLDVQDYVRQQVPLVNDFFARVLGRQVLEVVWIMSDSEEWVVDTWNELTGIQATDTGFGEVSKTVLSPTGWDTPWTIAHKLFHLLQMQLARVEESVYDRMAVVPIWLTEGAAGYYGLQYASSLGEATFEGSSLGEANFEEAIRWIGDGVEDPSALRSLETRQGIGVYSGSEDVVFAAIDFLISNFGELAIVEFHENLSPVGELRIVPLSGLDGREVFEETFGMSLEDFYGEFEAYMSSVP